MKISKYLHYIEERGVYLLLFLLPWQTRLFLSTSQIEYWQLSLYAVDILLILVGLIALQGAKPSWNIHPRKNPRVFFFLLFILYTLVSLGWGHDSLVGLFKIVHLFEAGVLFWLVARSHISQYRASVAFIAGAVLQALLGAAQFFAQTVWGSTIFGIASQIPETLGVSVVEYADERWLRAYGALPHPNILGGLLAIALLVLLGLLLSKHKTTWSPLSETLFFYGSAVALTAGLFFSFSRSAWLATAVGLLVIFASISSVTTSQRWQLGKVTLVIVVTFTVLTFTYLPLFYTRISHNSRLEHISTSERTSLIAQAGSVIRDAPVLGVGVGNYTHELVHRNPGLPGFVYQPVHNLWLLVIAEIGLVGFKLLLLMLGYALYEMVYKTASKKALLHAAPLAGLLVISLFDHYLWSLPVGLLITATALAFSLKSLQNS